MNNKFSTQDESLQIFITDYIIENSDEYKEVIKSAIDEIFDPTNVPKPIEDIRAYLTELSNKVIRQNEQDILEDFSNKLTSDMQDIPSEFVQIINDNFWDLI